VTNFFLDPFLQVLYLTNPMDESRLLSSRFPKLIELVMDRTNEETLLLVLGQVGKQLQKLRFGIYGNVAEMKNGEVHLDRVLAACPILSELSTSTNVSPRCDVSELRLDTLIHLHTLVIKTLCLCHLQSGLLQDFLRLAPNLRFVRLVKASVDSRELGQLSEVLKQRNSWSVEVIEVARKKSILPQWADVYMKGHFPVAQFDEPGQDLMIQMCVDWSEV
jgi:hypothetical protein